MRLELIMLILCSMGIALALTLFKPYEDPGECVEHIDKHYKAIKKGNEIIRENGDKTEDYETDKWVPCET